MRIAIGTVIVLLCMQRVSAQQLNEHELARQLLSKHQAMLLDETFKSSGWQPKDGLWGLVPGVSTGRNVKETLGEIRAIAANSGGSSRRTQIRTARTKCDN